MTVAEILVLLLVAGLCGALGQAIVGGSRGGCLVSVAVGFVGAAIGIWLARMLTLPSFFSVTVGGTAFPVVWAILGSAIFVALIHAAVRPGW